MSNSNKAMGMVVSDLHTPVEMLTEAEASTVKGGTQSARLPAAKPSSTGGAKVGVGGGVGLIIDFFANGKDSTLHKLGTNIGETAAKIYLKVSK